MGCANCGLVRFASVPTSPWTICTGSLQERKQAALGKLVFKGPWQGLAFPGKTKTTKVSLAQVRLDRLQVGLTIT